MVLSTIIGLKISAISNDNENLLSEGSCKKLIDGCRYVWYNSDNTVVYNKEFPNDSNEFISSIGGLISRLLNGNFLKIILKLW